MVYVYRFMQVWLKVWRARPSLSVALFPINGPFFFHLHENNMKTPRALKTELVELFAFPTNMPLTSLDQEFQPHFKKYRLNIYQIRKVFV